MIQKDLLNFLNWKDKWFHMKRINLFFLIRGNNKKTIQSGSRSTLISYKSKYDFIQKDFPWGLSTSV